MYRFLLRPRWLLFHLLCAGAVVLMVNLGSWQLRRLEERQAFNSRVEARVDEAPVPIDELLGADAATVEWRPVTAAGEYLADEEVLVVNRSQDGAAGDVVVTPLRLDDGRLLLVARGFVPLSADAAPAPSGPVEVVGRLRPSQERRRGQLSDPAEGELTTVQRVDIDRLELQLPGPPVGMYVELVSSQPSEAGPLPVPLDAPELGEGPHLSYAGQWFLFSAAVVVGWVLAVRHSVRARRAAPAGATSSAPVDEPAAAVGAGRRPSPG